MTTYNGERFLVDQMESVLRQSCADFELIIADDGSCDGTVDILAGFAKRDSRIRFHVNAENLGINRNVSEALALARGRYIAIADQDDIWEPNKLEVLLSHIGQHSAVYSDSELIDDTGRPLGMTMLERLGMTPATGHAALLLLRKNCVSGHALMFKRSLLDIMLPLEHSPLFDQQIGITAMLNEGLHFVNQSLVRHRLHGGNLTKSQLFKKPRERSSKAEQHSHRRAEFMRTLSFFLSHIERNKSHYAGKKSVASLLVKTRLLMERLRQGDHTWFDPRLFWLMLRIRNEFFYENESRKFKRCLSFAKGALYYR